MKLTIIVFLWASAISLTACGGPRTHEIDMVGKDFRFTPDTIRAAKGDRVIINFSNPDTVPHLIYLPEFNAHIGLTPGGAYPLEFVADQTGTFEYVCSVPGHQEAGMVGTLIVESN